MRKHNCKDVCGSLCLLQILKSEDSLLVRNDFVKEKNKYYTQNPSLPKELLTQITHFLFSGKVIALNHPLNETLLKNH